MFKVKINNIEKEFDKPIRALELLSQEDKYEYFACKLNYRLRELTYIINRDTEIEFLDLSDYNAMGIYLPLITTNCAVLGSALLNIQNEYNFVYSVAVGFAAAIGFTMAILIFAGVRARLQFAQAPKSFQGMPLVLISAGLIAMAFSGFSGINF